MISEKKVCIYGHTENENYGSLLTYYSLYNTLVKLGYNCFMIPRSSSVTENDTINNPCNPDSFSSLFFKSHCQMAPRLPFEKFKEYNNLADTFIIGSDMIWKHKQYRWARNSFYLDFIYDDKKKLACSVSFGTDNIDKIYESEDDIKCAKSLINRFDKITCREYSGVDIIKNTIQFPRECIQLIDPIFLTDKRDYENISKSAEYKPDPNSYAFVYSATSMKNLDNKLEFVNKKLNQLRLKGIFVADGHQKNDIIRELYSCFEKNVGIEQFLYYIINSKYVITDSFHGVCLSILFNKPFSYISRGFDETRIHTLKQMFNIEIRSRKQFCNYSFDWTPINNMVELEKSRSIEWLKKNI